MPQRRLAVLARINRNSLRFIESGKQEPTVYVLERILGCLGHELDAIAVVKAEIDSENISCKTDVQG